MLYSARDSIPGGETYPKPDALMQSAVGPITVKLTGHSDQAAELAEFYAAAADTIRRDAAGAGVLGSKHDLREFLQKATTIRFQGAFGQIPGLSDSIYGSNGALAKLLGLDAGQLDHARAAAALDAVAWACAEAS